MENNRLTLNLKKVKLLLPLFCLVCCFSCRSQDIETILSEHLEVINSSRIEPFNSGYKLEGTIDLQPYNLTLSFEYYQVNNEHQLFNQNELLSGADLIPQTIRIVNDEGAFLSIDESSINGNFQRLSMPDEAGSLWLDNETILLSPIYFLKRMGASFRLKGSTKFKNHDVHEILATTEANNTIGLYIRRDNGLLAGLKFDTFHPQLEVVSIEREILEYGEISGFAYPTKWIDDRKNVSLKYSISAIEPINSIPGLNDQGISKVVMSMNDEIKNSVLIKYVDAIRKDSPFSESNQKIEAHLFKQNYLSQYENVDNPTQFASLLQEDIIKVTGDYHFGIDYNPQLFESLVSEGDGNFNESEEFYSEEAKRNNFYVKESKLLQNGLFYLRMTEMPVMLDGEPFFDPILQEASKSKGLIIDLRNNTGGAQGFTLYLASHLLKDNTLLLTKVTVDGEEEYYTRKVNRIQELEQLPVLVLVSKNTVSAAEQIAYILQNHDRAIVIGERTFGAAHGSIDVPLKEGFVGFVPVAYEKHIKTGKDWEGTGVIPDILMDPNKIDISRLYELIKN